MNEFMYVSGAGIKFPHLWVQSNISHTTRQHWYDCTGLPTL